MRTVCDEPGDLARRGIVDDATRAPSSSGRTTRACSMPGSAEVVHKGHSPVTLAGMSTRGSDVPTTCVVACASSAPPWD